MRIEPIKTKVKSFGGIGLGRIKSAGHSIPFLLHSSLPNGKNDWRKENWRPLRPKRLMKSGMEWNSSMERGVQPPQPQLNLLLFFGFSSHSQEKRDWIVVGLSDLWMSLFCWFWFWVGYGLHSSHSSAQKRKQSNKTNEMSKEWSQLKSPPHSLPSTSSIHESKDELIEKLKRRRREWNPSTHCFSSHFFSAERGAGEEREKKANERPNGRTASSQFISWIEEQREYYN